MSNPYLVCSDRELRALPTQWLLAEKWEKAGSLLYDLKFTEAKTSRAGIDELLQDYATALQLLPRENGWFENLRTVKIVLDRQAYGLREWNPHEQRAFFLQQIRNEAFGQGWKKWRAQAEAELARLEQPYLLDRFPQRRDPAELRTLAGHTGEVNSVALSADGRLAVSASDDHTLKVWDISTGRELRTLKGHNESVNSVALSSDGRLAVSASDDHTLKVWDVETGRALRTLIDHSGQVRRVALSADGQLAVSGSEFQLKVWNVVTGKELYTLEEWLYSDGYVENGESFGFIGGVNSVLLSLDGELAVSASPDTTLKVWNVSTERELHALTGHSESVNGVALSADGQLAVSASQDKTLKVWDVPTGCELRTLTGHSNSVSDVALSADGRVAVSASSDETLKVWDVLTGRELHTLKGHSESVRRIALSTDGRLAVSASGRTLKVWDISTVLALNEAKDIDAERNLHTLTGHSEYVLDVALSADGRVAVSISDDETLKVWDISTVLALNEAEDINAEIGRKLCTLTGHNKSVYDVALSADGRVAISGSEDKTLKLWDVDAGCELRTLTGFSNSVSNVALSADGRLAVSGSMYRDPNKGLGTLLEVWDMTTGRKLHTLVWYNGGVFKVALSANGRVVAAVFGPQDKTIKVWDVSTGCKLHTLTGHSESVLDVALSANGRVAVSASLDGSLKVWDVSTGRELRTLTGHSEGVSYVALSADGRVAVSTSHDQTLKVWDVATGCSVATLVVGVFLSRCTMSADGKTIVARDNYGGVHFLELVNADELLAKDVKIEKSWLALKKETE